MIERLFIRWLGQERGLRAYWSLYERSGIALFALCCAAAALAWVVVFNPVPHTHMTAMSRAR